MIYPGATPRLKRLTRFWMWAVLMDDKEMADLFALEWSCEAREERYRQTRRYLKNKNRLVDNHLLSW